MSNLTEREKEVLNMVLEEVSTASIAQRLGISRRTVDAHRRNIIKKAGTSNPIGLYKYAIRHGLSENQNHNQ